MKSNNNNNISSSNNDDDDQNSNDNNNNINRFTTSNIFIINKRCGMYVESDEQRTSSFESLNINTEV